MIGPTFIFAFTAATITGAAFHLLVGGNAKKLTLYLITAWIGFLLGQFAGAKLSIEPLLIGNLNLISALTGAIILLITTKTLTDPQV